MAQNRSSLRFPTPLALLVVLGTCSPAAAQTTGSIEGRVRDPAGRAVAGAAVRITELDTSAERRLRTDVSGYFLAPTLPPGRYEVEVAQPGFTSEIRRGIVLAAGRTARVDFHLRLGAMHERIEVIAEAPLVSTRASDWGGSIERQKLDDLPLNGRDLFDLSSQELGAVAATTAVQSVTNGQGTPVSVNGARPNQNSFRLDGIYINDSTSSAPSSAAGRLLGVEGVRELRLITSPFSAEYGRTGGGILTAVSRSGSNEWHGSLYEFLRNSALDARNFFDPPDQRMPPLRKNQFGGLFSGPLRRNRVFFLTNYEAVRQTSSVTERSVTLGGDAREGHLPGSDVPVAPQVRPYLELYPLPNGRDFGDGTAEFIAESVTPTREDYAAGKLDIIVSDRLRFSSRYTFDDAETSSPDPFHLWTFISDSRYQFAHTETQYTHSPNTIHSFRAGFSRVRNAETNRLVQDVPASLSFVKGQSLGSIRVTGLNDIGGTTGLNIRLRPRQYVVNSFQFDDDVTHIHGAHTVRLGGGYGRIRFNQRSDLMTVGSYRFGSVADLIRGKPRSGELMAPGSDSIRGWRFHQFSGFVQDEVRLTSGLNFTIGVRYESSSSPTEANGKIATLPDPLHDATVTLGGPLYKNPSRKNFAPRAAIAWDPFGSGNTVVRAGAGIFFDLLGTRELMIAGARTPPFFERLLISSPVFPDLLEAARQASPANSVDGLDFRPHQPYTIQFQLVVQRELGPDTVVQLGYAGGRGVHLPGQLGEINTATPEFLPDGRVFFPAGAPRLNPAFNRIKWRSTAFNSNYHGLQVSAQRRLRSSFRFQVNYTWAKSIDEASSTINRDFLNSDQMPTMYNFRQNRGLSDFDLRHSLSANFSFAFPQPQWDRFVALLGGWEIHGIVQARTGHPFAPDIGFDHARLSPEGDDLSQRPDFVAAPGDKLTLGDPQVYFDSLAFGLPQAGFYGSLGRNTLTGPGLATLDVALHKVIWQRERHTVRLRLEAFNVTNHPNFQIPSGLSLFNSRLQRVGSAGQITETSTSARQIQLALKWAF